MDLLIEIGTEEIPARDAIGAAKTLGSRIMAVLRDNLLIDDNARLRSFSTPRRLAVLITGCRTVQEDREMVFTGPPWDRAFDAEGNPTRAALGFAKSHGVDTGMLVPADGKKGRVVSVKKLVKGRSTGEILGEELPDIIKGLEFKRTMRWADGRGPFVRPVHYLVGLLGDKVVPFSVFGLQSGRITRGHRFMYPGPISLTDAGEFVGALSNAGVELSFERRRSMILEGLERIAKENNCELITDTALVEEVANLVEYPYVLSVRFDDKFLKLPEEVLIEAMRRHQRYFAFRGADKALAPVFGVVANTKARDMDVVAKGNRRVLSARLYDSMYFWEKDLKRGIDGMQAGLGERVFMTGLGSVAEKTGRLQALATRLVSLFDGPNIDIDALQKAAALCKADLTSQMVGEFAELQGVMGAYYAEHAGYPARTAVAIREHYLPRFANDELPKSSEGLILAIADRIDTITAAFSKGYEPKAGKDPYALRRQALGLLRLMMVIDGYVSIDAITDQAIEVLNANGLPVTGAVRKRVLVFIRDRFEGLLRDVTGLSADFVNAVLAIDGVPVKEVVERLNALKDVYTSHEGFRDLMLAFKRMKNILVKAPSRDLEMAKGVNPDLLESALERELFSKASRDIEKVARMRETREFSKILELMYGYQKDLEAFFDTVRVLDAPSKAIVANRLALLGYVLQVFNWFGDFSMISTR